MSIDVKPHLNFRGDARSALEFYHSVFGGNLQIVTYADMGNAQEPSLADQVMYGHVVADSGFEIMAYDTPPSRPWDQGEHSFYVSVRCTQEQEVSDSWEKLVQGATILEPLGAVQWSSLYGMLKDKFGVTWVLDVVEPPAS